MINGGTHLVVLLSLWKWNWFCSLSLCVLTELELCPRCLRNDSNTVCICGVNFRIFYLLSFTSNVQSINIFWLQQSQNWVYQINISKLDCWLELFLLVLQFQKSSEILIGWRISRWLKCPYHQLFNKLVCAKFSLV